MKILEAKSLKKYYGIGTQILQKHWMELIFYVEDGEFVAVVGTSW